jgi:hypothetical protein
MKTSAQRGSAEKPSKNRLDEARHKMNNLPKRLLLEKIVPRVTAT